MKKITTILLALSLSGCFTIKYTTPAHSPAVLVSESQNLPFKAQKRVWYLFYGLVPLGDNSTADLIGQHDLKQVRLKTQVTVTDFILGAFTGLLTIYPMTITVEGK